MANHHEPRYAFEHMWYVQPVYLYVLYTTGEYYLYYDVLDVDFNSIAFIIQNYPGIGTIVNRNWPLMFAPFFYEKVSGPPAIFDQDIIGHNPSYPPDTPPPF